MGLDSVLQVFKIWLVGNFNVFVIIVLSLCVIVVFLIIYLIYKNKRYKA